MTSAPPTLSKVLIGSAEHGRDFGVTPEGTLVAIACAFILTG